MGLRSWGGGCVIQLVPQFCTKGRQTDPSQWDMQAWSMHAQKILASHPYCCWFELKEGSLTKILLGINTPGNQCTTDTKEFLLSNPYPPKVWLNEEGFQLTECRVSRLIWQASHILSNASELLPCVEDAVSHWSCIQITLSEHSLIRCLFVPPPSGEFKKLHSASLYEIPVIYDRLFKQKSNQTVKIVHVSQFELLT